jgi:hypothetical protein
MARAQGSKLKAQGSKVDRLGCSEAQKFSNFLASKLPGLPASYLFTMNYELRAEIDELILPDT